MSLACPLHTRFNIQLKKLLLFFLDFIYPLLLSRHYFIYIFQKVFCDLISASFCHLLVGLSFFFFFFSFLRLRVTYLVLSMRLRNERNFFFFFYSATFPKEKKNQILAALGCFLSRTIVSQNLFTLFNSRL